MEDCGHDHLFWGPLITLSSGFSTPFHWKQWPLYVSVTDEMGRSGATFENLNPRPQLGRSKEIAKAALYTENKARASFPGISRQSGNGVQLLVSEVKSGLASSLLSSSSWK